MGDQTPDSISETASLIREPASQIREFNFSIIVNLYPTDGTHWVLVIRREDGPVYYLHKMRVETLRNEHNSMMNFFWGLIVYL